MQLLQMSDLSSEQQECVNLSIASAKRLTRLLSDILDLSKIEAGKMEIREEEFDVRSLNDSIAELFMITARDKGIVLESEIDPSTPDQVLGDDARVRQILFNLVGNALKYTEEGRVSVTIGPVSAAQGGNIRLLFSVEDTGVGIREEKLQDLFKPFVQVDGSHTRRYQGAGLGLSIVRKLVDLMNGEISLESKPGQGTSVQVVLPFKTAPEKSRPEKTRADSRAPNDSQPEKQGLHILLAEDDPTNQFAMRMLLQALGHEVTLAGDGGEVLELLKNNEFDCVLMDIQMPVMDGLEATRAIRTSSEFKHQNHIPVIALTAHTMSGDREKFLQAGMNDYLAKPVEMDDLELAIKKHCSKL